MLRFAHRPYRLPLRTPLRTAHGPWTEREGLIVRVETADGRAGFGEVAPLPWFRTETLAEAEALCAGLRGQVGPDILVQIPERYGCVRFGVASALAAVKADVCAERQGSDQVPPVPGRATTDQVTSASPGAAKLAEVPPVPGRATADQVRRATKLPVAALLPAGKAALEVLPAKLEAGFLAFKWKVGVGRPEDELALLDDLFAALPAYAKLRLDANGGWDRRQAGRWLERCAERPVEFVEQPLVPGDEDGLLGLAADFPVTLALDESVVRLAEARRWQELGWRGVFVIKPTLCGPLEEIESWARATKADVVLSSAIETAVARAAILSWALRSGVTRRALGFGLAEIFTSAAANGPLLGPIADAGWSANVDLAEAWRNLSANPAHEG